MNELWFRFKEAGFSGSIAVRTTDQDIFHDNSPTFTTKGNSVEDVEACVDLDNAIYEAVFKMDPDYIYACIIKNSNDKPSDLISISFKDANSDDGKKRIRCALDDAILEGLAHQKAFIVEETNAIVKFGYKTNDLFK